MGDIVKIKSAMVSPSGSFGADPMKDEYTLSLLTEDKVEVKFTLDGLAVAMLAFATSLAAQGMKARLEATK